MSAQSADVPGKRVLTVKPRRRGYTHRPIIAVRENIGVLENGEVVKNLPIFARTQPHIWVTHDPTHLLNMMLAAHGNSLTYRFVDSRDPMEEVLAFQTTRLVAFGFDREKTGWHKAQHSIWQPTRMFSTPRIAADLVGSELSDLMKFAIDVREWCQENDLPLKSTLPGLAASLLRDKRFWPNPRGRVPRSTNERLRTYLPGVYQESRAPSMGTIPTAIALDQIRAYHRAAQQIPTPDPTNLYAHGYFNDPENAPELWAPLGSSLYERTIREPGIVAVVATSRPKRTGEWRPPICESRERGVRYVWTNELHHCQCHGLQVEGIVAAWTSETADEGLPRYGKWAEDEIFSAGEYRKSWLKPTLHALYGLLASRPRDLLFGNSHGKGTPEIYHLRGFGYPVMENKLAASQPITVNVATLGVLQSAIRQRTLELANQFPDDTLHVHADGLHLRATQLSFIPEGWSVEAVTNLQYLDDVSWISDERDVLPGRDQYVRLQLRKKLAAELSNVDVGSRRPSLAGRQDRAA